MTVVRNGSFKTRPNIYLHNDHLYEGSQNYLSISRPYRIDFQCDYGLKYYPFDIQDCTMDFNLGVSIIIILLQLHVTFFKNNYCLKATAREYAKLKKGTLSYIGNIDLREYYILSYDMYDNGSTSNWQIQVQLLLYQICFSKITAHFRFM